MCVPTRWKVSIDARSRRERCRRSCGGSAVVSNTGFGLTTLVATYGVLFIFLVVLVEEAGLPLPLPSDLMLLVSGSLVARGRLNLGLTLGSVVVATVLGTAALYTLARWGGRPLVLR